MKIGSLCTGYGGLDMAVEAAFGAVPAWVSDIDKGACKILDHRYPDVPNLGDMTVIDWATVEPVDIITGGTPCQDLSHAGKRAGMTEGTRSNLWVQMREAIATIRPIWVVWENVRGAYSAAADSDLESCPGCMGDPEHRGPSLRALGRVLGDLSDLGYDCQWRGLRAADVGAPHGRFRVFVIARLSDAVDVELARQHGERSGRAAAAGSSDESVTLLRTPTSQLAVNGGSQHPDKRKAGGHGLTLADEVQHLLPTPKVGGQGDSASERRRKSPNLEATVGEKLLGTPAARDHKGDGLDWRLPAAAKRGHLEAQLKLLPTPMAAEGTKPSNTMGEARRLTTGQLFLTNVIVSLAGLDPSEAELLPTPTTEPETGNGHARNLGAEARALLPTPVVTDLKGTTLDAQPDVDRGHGTQLRDIAHLKWGDYAGAVTRWEEALGRPAPDPTEPTGRGGASRLSARFTEWMMGVPEGWIVDVPKLTRNEALKACGNGVVPQQAHAAIVDGLRAFAAVDAMSGGAS